MPINRGLVIYTVVHSLKGLVNSHTEQETLCTTLEQIPRLVKEKKQGEKKNRYGTLPFV